MTFPKHWTVCAYETSRGFDLVEHIFKAAPGDSGALRDAARAHL